MVQRKPPSKLGALLYGTAVAGQWRVQRLAAMALVFVVLLVRSSRLFCRELAVVMGLLLTLSLHFGPVRVFGGALLLLPLYMAEYARRSPEVNLGHRAGAEGYAGPCCENTIEALEALVALDSGPQGPLPDLHYLEVDVQETKCGELVLLHDGQLRRSFPDLRPLHGAGVGPAWWVQELTLAQLQSLDLGGRPGLRVPTLGAFLDACRRLPVQCPLLVEVKCLVTDTGRARLVGLLRQHKPYADGQTQRWPQRQVQDVPGFLAVIAFPHHYAASFGEIGSAACRRWTRSLHEAGVPVRCCVWHALSFSHGM